MNGKKLLPVGKIRRLTKKGNGADQGQDKDKGKRDRYAMVSEAAYYNAEKRGFTPGMEDQDWYRAEEQMRQEYGW